MLFGVDEVRPKVQHVLDRFDEFLYRIGSRYARATAAAESASAIASSSISQLLLNGTNSDVAPTTDTLSIYDEIGGRKAVDAVISDVYDRVLADEQLREFFKGMEMTELHAHQVQFISSVAGGPVSYTGAEMRKAHAHLDIEKEDFDAVASYLEDALRENGVCEENVNDIMSEIETFETPILNQ